MLNLINKETRQIPGWPVVQGRGVDRVRSTQPPPRGWETLLVISRCLASLSHPLWHSPSQSSLSKAARYVHHIRTRQSRIMIDVRRINRTRALAIATRCTNAYNSPPLWKSIFRNSRPPGELSADEDSKVFRREKWISRYFGRTMNLNVTDFRKKIESKNSLESVRWKVETRATRRDAQSNTVSR